MLITLVPKVFLSFLIRWLNIFEIFIGWSIKLSVHQPLIVIYKRDIFVYYHGGYKSIYRPLSYSLTSLDNLNPRSFSLAARFYCSTAQVVIPTHTQIHTHTLTHTHPHTQTSCGKNLRKFSYIRDYQRRCSVSRRRRNSIQIYKYSMGRLVNALWGVKMEDYAPHFYISPFPPLISSLVMVSYLVWFVSLPRQDS